MKYLHCIFLVVLCSSSLLAQNQQSELRDILEFKTDSVSRKISKWYPASHLYGKQPGKAEKISLGDGRNVVSLTFPVIEKPVDISMYSGFLMPVTGNTYMEASVLCKNQGFDIIRLIFSGFNTTGNLISVDTLNVGAAGDWQKSTRMIPIKNVSYMRLILEMHSSAQNKDRTLWFENIQLKVSGNHLDEYPLDDIKGKFSPEMHKVVNLSFSDLSSYKHIQELNTKKFVALGESIHGSETLARSAIQIMKYRILHGNCRLILLESPLEKMLSINRFVQGDDRFSIEAIATSLELGLYSSELLDFFVWVKEFNRTAERKVFLLGMDTPSTYFYLYTTELFDYFYRMNKNTQSDSIRTFLQLNLTDCRNALKNILPSIKNNPEFKMNNDSLDIKMIEHWWKEWLKVPDYERVDIMRDSIMYSNIKYMSELLCTPSETVTIYSHLVHACRDKATPFRYLEKDSYGSLLQREFTNDYFVIGLFAYQGDVLLTPRVEELNKHNYREINFYKKDLESLSMNSLEHLMHEVGYQYFYTPVSILPTTQLYVRMGTNEEQLAGIIHPFHYINGIIYVEDSQAMRIVHGDIPFSIKSENLTKRFNEYETLIK